MPCDYVKNPHCNDIVRTFAERVIFSRRATHTTALQIIRGNTNITSASAVAKTQF